MNHRLAIALALLGTLASDALAQIVPERTYYGVDRRVPVRVDAPEGFAGDLTIKLIEYTTGREVAQAAAAAGRADLAALLPVLWEDKPMRALRAQLYADGEALGPAIVVQPLFTPNRAALVDEGTLEPSKDPRAKVMFEDDLLAARKQRGKGGTGEREVTFSGYRLYPEREVVVETTSGEMVFRMRPDAAPNTVWNFLTLVDGGFYTDIVVHRVVAALPDGRPFVIQFGDLSGTGSGGPGYAIDLEKSTLPHAFGVLSMARDVDPDTNGSQVFVCLSRAGTSFLDGRYTAFAEAVSGADVVRAIASVEVGPEDRPVEPPVVLRAFTRAAPPVGSEPPPLSAGEVPTPEQGAKPVPKDDR